MSPAICLELVTHQLMPRYRGTFAVSAYALSVNVGVVGERATNEKELELCGFSSREQFSTLLSVENCTTEL